MPEIFISSMMTGFSFDMMFSLSGFELLRHKAQFVGFFRYRLGDCLDRPEKRDDFALSSSGGRGGNVNAVLQEKLTVAVILSLTVHALDVFPVAPCGLDKFLASVKIVPVVVPQFN